MGKSLQYFKGVYIIARAKGLLSYYYFTWNSNHAGQPRGLSAHDLVLIEHQQLVVAAARF